MFTDLYKIINTTDEGRKISIKLNEDSVIFHSHFPNFPILPGACITAIAQELLAKDGGTECSVSKFSNVKFLKTINPKEVQILQYNFETTNTAENSYKVSTTVTDENNEVIAKFTLVL